MGFVSKPVVSVEQGELFCEALQARGFDFDVVISDEGVVFIVSDDIDGAEIFDATAVISAVKV